MACRQCSIAIAIADIAANLPPFTMLELSPPPPSRQALGSGLDSKIATCHCAALRIVNNPARGPHGSQDQFGSFGLGQALFCCQRRPEVQNSLWTNSTEVWCEDAEKRLVYLPKVRRSDVSARTIDKASKVLNAINRR